MAPPPPVNDIAARGADCGSGWVLVLTVRRSERRVAGRLPFAAPSLASSSSSSFERPCSFCFRRFRSRHTSSSSLASPSSSMSLSSWSEYSDSDDSSTCPLRPRPRRFPPAWRRNERPVPPFAMSPAGVATASGISSSLQTAPPLLSSFMTTRVFDGEARSRALGISTSRSFDLPLALLARARVTLGATSTTAPPSSLTVELSTGSLFVVAGCGDVGVDPDLLPPLAALQALPLRLRLSDLDLGVALRRSERCLLAISFFLGVVPSVDPSAGSNSDRIPSQLVFFLVAASATTATDRSNTDRGRQSIVTQSAIHTIA